MSSVIEEVHKLSAEFKTVGFHMNKVPAEIIDGIREMAAARGVGMNAEIRRILTLGLELERRLLAKKRG